MCHGRRPLPSARPNGLKYMDLTSRRVGVASSKSFFSFRAHGPYDVNLPQKTTANAGSWTGLFERHFFKEDDIIAYCGEKKGKMSRRTKTRD